ncbi:MAG: tRNA pseudouridine(55) synthase TruB [Lachnospiraceae bacterium]|jgi:tRNA pseudouridine55 synthase|nr:tRNA pseudouridine(55) synthase TruB [Lachnospiraceae bacterium]
MDGIIIVNKPKGFTSHDVVQKMRRIMNTKKIGHTGTLDPNATGVLPILIGRATKLSNYLVEHNKTYIALLKLGKKTTTGDLEGSVIEEKEVPILEVEEIKTVLNSFLGKQKQIPPMYSSVKINGKKLYEYARKGEIVEVPARDIEIYNIKLLQYKKSETEIEFEVECSKGTYIRTLCEDIAKRLGTVGFMKELVRTKVDIFALEKSVALEDLEKIESLKKQSIILIEDIFVGLEEIYLDEAKLKQFLNGVKLPVTIKNGLCKVYFNEEFIGLGKVLEGYVKREICL